ncbi:MAG: calcium-binding protein [Hyphomicrobium sp.]|nr:calcium-binding protein [Hyphomicrobium sp.]
MQDDGGGRRESGNNELDGGPGGADELFGDLGNDTYVLGSGNDTLLELVNSGIDTITSTISRNIAGLANVENILLLGTANISATDNRSANTLSGNSGNNLLQGAGGDDLLNAGGGVDSLRGGLGSDTYVLGGENGVVSDTGGIDTITSPVYRNLLLETGYLTIENLTLTGTDNIEGVGNSLNNTLVYNSGNNVLNASAGRDVLTGNGGADQFQFGFRSESSNTNPDVITDFNSAQADKIDLSLMASHDFNDPISFIGTANFVGDNNTCQVRYQAATNGGFSGTEIRINRDQGPGAVGDSHILLRGVTSIAEADFILF